MTKRLAIRPLWSRQGLALSAAALVIAIGVVTLAGWALDAAMLVRIIPGQTTTKPNTALALILCGAGLIALVRAPRQRRTPLAAAIPVLGLALATIAEYLLDVDLGIDHWLKRGLDAPSTLHPNRMPIATAVGITLAATALLLLALGPRALASTRAPGILGGCVLAIGALGLIGYALDVVVLYTWYGFGSMALPSAAAFVLLGSGLLAAARRGDPAAAEVHSEERRIIHAATLALLLAAGATGVAGIAALESQVFRSVENELQNLLRAELGELATNIELRTTRAEIITSRPNMLRNLRILVADPDNAQARGIVQDVLKSFLGHDFSMLAVALPGVGEVARAGDEPGPPDMEIHVGATARLLWRGHLALRHELPLSDATGPLGTVIAEQRLPQSTHALLGNPTAFASAELLVCGHGTSGPLRCFPSRLSASPVVVPPGPSGAPRLAQRAVTEGAGVGIAVDYRGQRVVGAFAPLASRGLVSVLKVDVDELYAPLRRQLGLALLLVGAATVAGLAVIQARVGPLAARLESHVRDRTVDVAQVNARLRILHEIDRGLIAAQAPVAVAEAALRPLQELLRVPRVIVNIFDFEAGEAEWLAAVGRRSLRTGPGVRFPLALMGDVDGLRRGEVQLVEVTALPPSPARDALLASGVELYRVVPMIAGGELIGGLSFGGAAQELTPEQIEIAQQVATQMAIVMAQARLHERIRLQAEGLELRVEARTLELRQANTRLEEEIAERRRAETEAESANRAKSEFLSRMSHELRTPLNSILGFGQLLELEGVSAGQRESVEHIVRAGRHLLGLIDEVLDISRIEAGRMRLSLEPVGLHDLVRSAMDLVQPLATARGIALRVDPLPAEQHVHADRQRLQQVLLNLLSNAVKYTPPGGTATVSVVPAGERIELRVTDTGVGIAADKLERLFTPFDRLGAEASGTEGTGLGLTLSKHLVEAMGGVLTVDSRPGVGSTFSVGLPAAEAPVDVALPRPWAPASPSAPAEATRAVVLYIEDNLANLRLVEQILARRPAVRLVSAMQGRVGRELAAQHRPQLILLDQHLPDENGDVVLQRLAEDPRTRDIPVIVLSADANPRQIQRLRELGARDYLTKPLDVRRLLALLDDVLLGRAATPPA